MSEPQRGPQPTEPSAGPATEPSPSTAPAAAAPATPATARARGAAGRRLEDFDLLKALFLGVVVTAVFYEVFPLPFVDDPRFLQLFDNRVAELIVGLTLWSLFLLGFKYLRHRRERKAYRALQQPLVRQVLGEGVYARNADEVAERVRGALAQAGPKHADTSVAYLRVARILDYIRAVPKKESINDLLDYQAQIDVKKMEAGYTILQVFIWAIPILGFIGTVLGIGESVSEFSTFIQSAQGGAEFGSQMRNALGGVTSGLAVAFNTTFLALVLVVPVMILTSVLNKGEQELLLSIEEYCLEDLLPHLHITPASDTVSERFDEHLHRVLQLSNTWLGQLEPLVGNLSRQAEMMRHQLAGIQPLVKEFTDQIMGAGVGRETAAEEEPRRDGAERRDRSAPGDPTQS